MKVDFLIVACASIKQIDIIYSGDREAMSQHKLGKRCIRAYRTINNNHKLKLPIFWKYSDLKRRAGV